MFFYVFKGDGTTLFSPEFERQGLAALFGMNILQVFNSPTLTIAIEGRNQDQTTFSSIGTFSAITTSGLKTSDQGGLPEILRFSFTTSGATTRMDRRGRSLRSP